MKPLRLFTVYLPRLGVWIDALPRNGTNGRVLFSIRRELVGGNEKAEATWEEIRTVIQLEALGNKDHYVE